MPKYVEGRVLGVKLLRKIMSKQSKRGKHLELELVAKGLESHRRHKQGAVRGAEWVDVGDSRQIERKCLCFLRCAQGWAGSI